MTITRIVGAPGYATVRHVSSAGVVEVPIRRASRFDDFVGRLGEELAVPAEVCDGDVPVPGDGTLVICRPDVLYDLAEAQSATLSWVVAVDLFRNHVLNQAELHGLAAAVESLDFDAWLQSSTNERPAIYGRLDAAAQIDAIVSTNPLHVGTRYARMTRPGATDLPALLATYLTALERLRGLNPGDSRA